MLYAHVPTPWDPNEKPKSQIVGGEAGQHRYRGEERVKSSFRLDQRRPDAEFISNSQYVQPEGKPIELYPREIPARKRLIIPFEDRKWQGSRPTLNQFANELIRHEFQRERQRVFFRFEDRRWNIAFLHDTQFSDTVLKPATWYAISDANYFPPRLKQWLKGRCFMMVRLRSGGGQLGTPLNGYVTEDGQIFYVAEDGSTFYVQET